MKMSGSQFLQYPLVRDQAAGGITFTWPAGNQLSIQLQKGFRFLVIHHHEFILYYWHGESRVETFLSDLLVPVAPFLSLPSGATSLLSLGSLLINLFS